MKGKLSGFKWEQGKIPRLSLKCRLQLYAVTVILAVISLIDTISEILPRFAGIIINVLAAGTLLTTCYYLAGDIRHGVKEKAMRGIQSNSFASHMAGDYRYRTVVFAVPGLILNLIFAVFNGGMGIAGRSAWFGTLSVYYGLLSMMRFHVVMYDRKTSKLERTKPVELEELLVYRNCGILFIIMTAALIGAVILLQQSKGGKHYPGVAIFAVAAYTFYKAIVSVINLVKAGKMRTPLLMAIRDIGYIDACVSVLTLQTAMFAAFGDGQMELERMMTGMTGFAVCLMVLVMGLHCIRDSSRRKKELLKGGNACDSHTCGRG